MARYVLTKDAEASADGPQGSVLMSEEKIWRLPYVRLLDQIGRRVFLIEVDPAELARFRSQMRGWTVVPEVVYGAPEDNGSNLPSV
jgi:hypothetical protein